EVLDLAGNKGSPVTATDDNTQVVLDTTTPTLSGITLVSTNANDSQAFAKPGDNITLSFNSSEPIQTPVIVLADNDSLTVHDTSSNQDGTSWEVVYTVNTGEEERDTTFSIDFKDIAGNKGVSKDQTVVTNTIKIDTSIPTLSVVSLSGGSNNLANEGDVVSLNFTGSELLKDPIVTLAGETSLLHGQESSWDITYLIEPGDDSLLAPSEIADLVLWLDGANIDGKMNHTFQEGESVRVWKDLSGKGHDAVQSVSTHYPVLNKADRTLEFDGNGDHFNIPDHPDLSINHGDDQEITVITVYESHTHGQLRGILSRSSASGSGSTDYIYFVENYGTRGDSVYWGTGSASGGLGTWFFTPEPTQDSTHILFGSLKADGNQSGTKQFFVDGLSRSETVDFSYTVKSNIPEAQIKIGTATGFHSNQSFDGELKEIII
ncbi:MAG: hypothetical protein VYE57_01970, partial [SAR324 cluster bacterium]|nr:hypothetical protein [SAR324 cluster bacterium]